MCIYKKKGTYKFYLCSVGGGRCPNKLMGVFGSCYETYTTQLEGNIIPSRPLTSLLSPLLMFAIVSVGGTEETHDGVERNILNPTFCRVSGAAKYLLLCKTLKFTSVYAVKVK